MTEEAEKVQQPPVAPKPGTPRESPAEQPGAASPAFTVRGLSVFFGRSQVLKGVSLDIAPRAVTAIIGPSGCGKSTFLRALNRMHDLVPIARVEGEVRLFGQDIY